jgi:hypothetical protein
MKTSHAVIAALALLPTANAALAQSADVIESTTVTESADTETVKPRKHKRHHVRMALELGAIMGIGYRWYWRDNGEPNRVDWQLGFGNDALIEKTTSPDGWRFDGNSYTLNALGHPGFGVLTHFLARENGYTMVEAFAISTLMSGGWELFVEWAEYGSLNDLAMTSPVGIPLGEAAHQIIHHARETAFEFSGGAGMSNGQAVAATAVRGDLNLIPKSGEGTFFGSEHVSFGAEMTTDANGVRGAEGGAKTTLGGYYRNTADSSLFLGASSEFYYRNFKDRDEREWDLLSTIAIGPTVDMQLRRGDITVDAGADLYLDFGMIKSQAFAGWREKNPMATVRNVMQSWEHPYYYAAGGTLAPRVNVSYKNYSIGGKLSATVLDSIDGHDRDEEMLTMDPGYTDHEVRSEAWLGYQKNNISVVLDGRMNLRGGTAGDVKDSTTERTLMATVGYRL